MRASLDVRVQDVCVGRDRVLDLLPHRDNVDNVKAWQVSGDVSWLMRKTCGDRTATPERFAVFADDAPARMFEGLDKCVLDGVCGDRKWADMIIIHVGPRGFA